ncbi:MAG: thermonuclease family protein [Rickettsiales bacterium]|jgi:endonuclease YncB( thermonuclease family)|nr:thermonuclease family protein [Rickettsiales bacterium]
MIKANIFIRFYLFVFLSVWPSVLFSVPAQVGYIFDGDTFSARVMLEDDIKISVRVRIINIDAPEMNGECDSEKNMALKSKNRLAELLPVGSVVDLSEIKDDKYLGRIDARVKTNDGADVGEVLVKEKLARKYNGGKRAPWCGNSR